MTDPIMELAEWIVDEYAAWMQNFNNLQTDTAKDDPYTPTAPQFIADRLRSRLKQVGWVVEHPDHHGELCFCEYGGDCQEWEMDKPVYVIEKGSE